MERDVIFQYGMDGIEIYLKRFEKIKPPDDFLRNTLVSLLSEKFGIKIKPEAVKVSHGRIYVNADPIAKSGIYMNMEKISAELGRTLEEDDRTII